MIFRHCWGCMLEVTPSRRRYVRRRDAEVLLIPMNELEIFYMCESERLGLYRMTPNGVVVKPHPRSPVVPMADPSEIDWSGA